MHDYMAMQLSIRPLVRLGHQAAERIGMATNPGARPLKESDIVEDLGLLVSTDAYYEEPDHSKPLLEEKVCLYWLKPKSSDRSLGSVWWKRKRKKAYYASLSYSSYKKWSNVSAAQLTGLATSNLQAIGLCKGTQKVQGKTGRVGGGARRQRLTTPPTKWWSTSSFCWSHLIC